MLTVSEGRSRNRSKSPGRRDISPARAVSPPKSSKSARSKKRYDSDSDSEAVSASDSGDDRRSSRRKKSEKGRRRGDSDSESESDDDRRHAREVKYERSNREYVKVPEQTRHLSYSDRGHGHNEYEVPGSFEKHEERGTHGTRHLSYVEIEPNDARRQKVHEAPPGPYMISTGGRSHYQVAPKYEYAEPPQSIKYLSKSDLRQPDARRGDGEKKYYVQTAHPQMELESRQLSRKDSEDKHKKSRRGSDEDRQKALRRDSDKHHSSRRELESESESDSDRHKSSKKKSSRSKRDSDSDDGRRKKDKHRPSASHDHRPQVIEVKPGQKSLVVREDGSRSHRLSVSGGAPGGLSLAAPGHQVLVGGLPPGSPLLEAYRGTYQSISPMPSPMAMPSHMNDGLSDVEPLEPAHPPDSDSDSDRPKKSRLKKRVEIYDPEPDALAIAAELKAQKPGGRPLIKILPRLSDDNMMHLRTEYKKHFKVNGKGINVAKHIKLKVQGNIGKVAYATALGRWESEAHWANFWYQSGSSRRELLIESLIGRSNAEIRQIKEAFSDKRYNDSLEKCMQTELKKDKFRNAILIALHAKRQDELAPISKSLVAEDVRDLYKALVAKDGGETAMIEIIVVRSDLHLRQVLKQFEEKYQRNFAREMIQKSQNLVVRPHFYDWLSIGVDTITGRNTCTHPQRRAQQARPRRDAPTPGASRNLQGPSRAPHLSLSPLPLGAQAP
jgi:hypothetical protein